MNNNDLDVITKQGYYVVKGNELIQKNRYKLSLAEQKTIAYICSMIKPGSSSGDYINLFQLWYIFNIWAFTIRMYELLKAYGFQKSKIFAIEELKHLLMVDDIKSYERFPDFRRRVLDIACDEINALTDIVVKYELIKNGRKFEKIKFFIREKSSQELLLVEKSEKNFHRTICHISYRTKSHS